MNKHKTTSWGNKFLEQNLSINPVRLGSALKCLLVVAYSGYVFNFLYHKTKIRFMINGFHSFIHSQHLYGAPSGNPEVIPAQSRLKKKDELPVKT